MSERISFCGSCGAQLDSGARFCPSCGAVRSAPAAPVQQSVPTPVQQPVQQYAPPAQYAPAPQYVQPAYAGGYAPAAVKKKKGGAGCLIAVIALLLIITLIVTGFIWPAFVPMIIRSLTPAPGYVTNGYTESVSAGSSSDSIIGDLGKEGIQLDISAGAFKDGSKVKLEALPKDETKEFEKEGYNIVGSVISVTADDYEGEMFAEPVTLTLDLPVAQMDTSTDKCDYFVGYFNEKTKEWQLYEPEEIDVKNGKATINVMHFTHLAIVDPEENETVEKYLKDWCAEKARRDTIAEEGKEAFRPYVKALAEKMAATKDAQNALAEALVVKLVSGINTDTKAGKLVSGSLDFTNTVGWGAYRAIESGDTDEFKNALGTATAKALTMTLTSEGDYVNFVGASGSIGQIAGNISGGDYPAAIQATEDALMNFFPTANAIDKAAKYVVRKVDMDYTMWKKDRIDDLYVKWRDGFETHPGKANSIEIGAKNFDELLEYMEFDTHSNKSGFGNADMMLKRIYDSDQKIDEQVERYGFGHRSYSSLSNDEKKEFAARVTHGLKEYFEQRYKNETKAKAMEQEEIEFVNYLYKWGYLRSGNYTEFFRDSGKGEFSISNRLDRLHTIRNTISLWADTGKMKEHYKDYSDLVSHWIDLHIKMSPKEARVEFLKYLKENDLLKKGINIPEPDDVTIDDIVGTWDVDATFTDIDSPMLDWFSELLKDLFGGIAEELGGDADDITSAFDDSYKDGASAKQKVTIEKISRDRVSVVISSSEGESSTYEGTLNEGVLSLKLTKSTTSDDDAVVLEIQNLEYKFYKTNGYVKMEGTYYIRSLAFNATYIYNGYKD